VREVGGVTGGVDRVQVGVARPRRGRLPGEAGGAMRLADICVAAIADCFRGDGEIVANPIGTIPMIGGRLARATFEPELMMTDGEAFLVADDRAFFGPNDARTIEYHTPYRSMFVTVRSGRRH